MTRIMILFALLFSFACSRGGAESKDKSEFYELELTRTEAGLVLTIKPKKGFKWNNEYPFKLKVIKLEGAVPERLKYKKADITIKEKSGVLEIKFKEAVDAAVKVKLEGKANFSVCDEKQCKIFRNKEITLEK